MVRTPDGSATREVMMSARVTGNDVVAVDRQRAFRGGMSRSAYIRWLVREDGKRIERENARGN